MHLPLLQCLIGFCIPPGAASLYPGSKSRGPPVRDADPWSLAAAQWSFRASLMVLVLVIEFFGCERADSAAAPFRRSPEFLFPGGDVQRVSNFKAWPNEWNRRVRAKEFDHENDNGDESD